jgi:hypothetical protein
MRLESMKGRFCMLVREFERGLWEGAPSRVERRRGDLGCAASEWEGGGGELEEFPEAIVANER